MKFFFSITLLILMNTSFATPYILVSYKTTQNAKALLIERIFKNRFKLPSSYYKFELNENSCISKTKPKAAHLCLENNDEIKLVFRNRYILERTLGVYWK
ncbi:hypothetical protein [Halobacteriovorax sp. HLS]|uniref:hypothetical protein n=1 Tax=Halobacteriovorax sp. HLS TaxID=2234000 RepID=UPI000FDCCA70|nr:hypothetical protein [Halobacteriovorax sp. HLS]